MKFQHETAMRQIFEKNFHKPINQSFYEASIYAAASQRCNKNTLEYAF